MHWSKEEIEKLPKVQRLNLINSVTGIKPANLIGTRSASDQSNLAIFSSVVHLGSNPALLGFIVRPTGEVPRHTYENILETGVYTINQIPVKHVAQAHYTSAKFERDQNEFELCAFKEVYLFDFPAPFVGESPLKIGMKYKESIPIALNDTVLVIGEIENLWVDDTGITDEGYINLEALEVAGISGLNSYYELKKRADFPFARPHELPTFQQ